MIELNQGGVTTCIDSSYDINYNGTSLTDIWVCDTTNAVCCKVWQKQTPVEVSIDKYYWGGKLNTSFDYAANGGTCTWASSTLTGSHCAKFVVNNSDDTNYVTLNLVGQGNTSFRCSGCYVITIDNSVNTTSTSYTFTINGSENNLKWKSCLVDTSCCHCVIVSDCTNANNRTCTYSCSITVPGGCCCEFELPLMQYQHYNYTVYNNSFNDGEVSCQLGCWCCCYACISEYQPLTVSVVRDGQTICTCSGFTADVWNGVGSSRPTYGGNITFCA